ncbi:MAG: respiratory nitrate reductase subunit gamma [Gammaproteobacteria bacterium]|nr:MAG: respiratory nitrate reductase subunit gamma [Gammaproteobacteria bacterium]
MLDLQIVKRANRQWIYTISLLATFLFSFCLSYAQTSGEDIFKQNCVVCHRTDDQKMVGPGLKGINEKRSEEWLNSWIKNSQKLIESGDQDAIAIYEEYNKTLMLPYEMYSDDEIKSVLAYIDVAGEAGGTEIATASPGASDTSQNDQLVLSDNFMFMFYIAIGLFAFILIVLIWIFFLAKNLSSQLEYPFMVIKKNHNLVFILMLLLASLIVYLLAIGLIDQNRVLHVFLFTIFPYLSIFIFIIGSIIRYRSTGFKVSSLSSQFLEGKQLFWGSQPFHWGLLVLFTGHLTAFLFPSSIILWNGSPVRLLILEGTSFVFGLSVLFGLFMLIKRRLTSKTLLMVSNNMDLLVYVVLLVQVISGLSVAYYLRWGSSWFAGVLTPYLNSVFVFNPDIAAVSALHWLIQIHIFSAFFILALIPFTRFMHFLVAPIDYLWRSYQIVTWNWNRKAIRTSTKHTFGREIKNH